MFVTCGGLLYTCVTNTQLKLHFVPFIPMPFVAHVSGLGKQKKEFDISDQKRRIRAQKSNDFSAKKEGPADAILKTRSLATAQSCPKAKQ